MLSVNGRNGALQLMADGARIEQLNPDTGKYETIKQLPSGFG